MFYEFPKDFKEFEPLPGIIVHSVSGRNVMLARITLKPKSEAPIHSHDEEQMGIIMEGEADYTIAGETKHLKKGDTYLIPSNIEHGVVSHTKQAVVIDVFSPPREKYK